MPGAAGNLACVLRLRDPLAAGFGCIKMYTACVVHQGSS
jgi:hypothetical protein